MIVPSVQQSVPDAVVTTASAAAAATSAADSPHHATPGTTSGEDTIASTVCTTSPVVAAWHRGGATWEDATIITRGREQVDCQTPRERSNVSRVLSHLVRLCLNRPFFIMY